MTITTKVPLVSVVNVFKVIFQHNFHIICQILTHFTSILSMVLKYSVFKLFWLFLKILATFTFVRLGTLNPAILSSPVNKAKATQKIEKILAVSKMPSQRVYIGNLGSDVRERDIEKFFKGFGKLGDISIKNGYGFVDFDDYRDADDAVHDLDGKDIRGVR